MYLTMNYLVPYKTLSLPSSGRSERRGKLLIQEVPHQPVPLGEEEARSLGGGLSIT
jgi:hypothetical protein